MTNSLNNSSSLSDLKLLYIFMNSSIILYISSYVNVGAFFNPKDHPPPSYFFFNSNLSPFLNIKDISISLPFFNIINSIIFSTKNFTIFTSYKNLRIFFRFVHFIYRKHKIVFTKDIPFHLNIVN